jgi:uncharacterized protein
MSIVGLDLAGVENRPTGYCLLKGMTVETHCVFTNQEILELILEVKPRVVAIDAPLCLPPGRKTIEERTNIHLRESDRALLDMGIKLFPITLGPMRKLTVRGINIKQTLEKQGLTVIEAYPGGAQDIWGIPRKQKGLCLLKEGLEKLGLTGLDCTMSDHELDAVTIAYVGKLFLRGQATVYGAANQGIVMPKGSFKKKK